MSYPVRNVKGKSFELFGAEGPGTRGIWYHDSREKKGVDSMNNEVLEAMQMRRSIRSFKPDPVPEADLREIVKAGLYAASGRGSQDTIILAITNPAMVKRLSRLNCEIGGWTPDFDPFYGAPAVLVVLAEKARPTAVYDGSLVMGNLMLAAHSLGLGSCWIHRAEEEFDRPEGKALLKTLGITGEYEGIGHCVVGYVEGDIPVAPLRKDHRVYWMK